MPKSNRKKISPKQIPMEGFEPSQSPESKHKVTNESKKLEPDLQKLGLRKSEEELFQAIPELLIKTRWERLEKAIDKQTHIKTIIRPVPDAIEMITRLIMSVRSTSDCKIVVVKANSGMGKTTFLNTLDLYIPDNQGVKLKIQTIDIAILKTAEDYLDELRKREIATDAVNIIILEGRETPGDITREFIDGVISKTTRFSRMHNQPMLVVVPTNEDSVARTWVSVAAKTGGLAPTGLPGGQQWYDFPGVPKEKYIEIAEETVRVLNKSQTITDFGITLSEMSNLVDMSDTIGQYLESLSWVAG